MKLHDWAGEEIHSVKKLTLASLIIQTMYIEFNSRDA